MAELAPCHVAVEILLVELEPGGETLDDARQAGTVRLAGRDETETHGVVNPTGGARKGAGYMPSEALRARTWAPAIARGCGVNLRYPAPRE